MAEPLSSTIPVVRSEPRTRSALWLEAITLRHQIAVPERSRTRRSCFRRIDRLFWILLSRWWRSWRESLVIVQPDRCCVGAVTAGLGFGDIDRVAAGEVDVP